MKFHLKPAFANKSYPYVAAYFIYSCLVLTFGGHHDILQTCYNLEQVSHYFLVYHIFATQNVEKQQRSL